VRILDTNDKSFEREIIPYVCLEIKNILKNIDYHYLKSVEEIRLRADKPMMIQNADKDWFVKKNGSLSRESADTFIVKQADIIKTLELMSENSVYAYQDEIKNGFITLRGGHRIGITGKIVLDGNIVKNIKDISGLNIRVSKEIYGCSSQLIPYIINANGNVYNTLIVSPPGCGKTTLLRDLSRVVSNGAKEYGFHGLKVGVIDERSEIAACYKGVSQNEIGIRTDVLDGCPKAIGMSMMLRSMSPQVIITDEIGNQGDKEAVMRILNAGVKIITTAHGYNISELKTRQEVLGLIEEQAFERFIVLSKIKGPGTVEEIVDGTNMKIIHRRVLDAV
jgi:stage III sporulation protein AA